MTYRKQAEAWIERHIGCVHHGGSAYVEKPKSLVDFLSEEFRRVAKKVRRKKRG